MGPEIASAAVQRALAMGAHRGFLVTDDTLRGADALVTARVLAAAVGRTQDIDLVIAGVESTDGYTGTLPATVAELLELPSVTFARGARRRRRCHPRRTADRATGYDVVDCPLHRRGHPHRRGDRAALPQPQGVVVAK